MNGVGQLPIKPGNLLNTKIAVRCVLREKSKCDYPGIDVQEDDRVRDYGAGRSI